MLAKSSVIALHSVRFGEKSLVAYVYSEQYGRLTLMVNSAFGKSKSGGKAIFFQPLSILSTVFYHSEKKGMHRLKEVTPSVTFHSIPYDPVKRAIALFIGEIIYRVVREEEENPPLYIFLNNTIQVLDLLSKGVSNFHLLFLVQLTRYLGFSPGNSWSTLRQYFDFKNGLFVASEPSHPLFFARENSELLGRLLSISYNDVADIELSHNQRNAFLDALLSFYAVHISGMGGIRSLPVLTQVFED